MAKVDGMGLGYSYHLPTAGVSLKIKNYLSQFSDIFSEFNKYIAPAYHHDRCERSVQMRLYSMHKRDLILVLMAFFGCLGLGIFIGLAGPPITLTTEIDAKTLFDKTNRSDWSVLATGPFKIRMPPMTTYNQQLWLIAKLTTDNEDDESFDKTFSVKLSIEGLRANQKPVPIVSEKEAKNRTRHLVCVKNDCKEFKVLHLGYLEYTHYMATLRFYDLESFHKKYTIKELKFFVKTYNPAFTQIEIWFRFIFLTSTFMVTCWFGHTLKKYAVYDWSIEQKWISILLPCLLFYDNPLFALNFLCNSWVPGMINAVGQSTFMCAICLFLLCIYHGLRQNDRQVLSFYLPKIFLVSLLWMPTMVLAFWEKCLEKTDPTFNHTVDESQYDALVVFFYIVGGVYLVYLSFLILRAYTELRSMPFFDLRLKALTFLMCTVSTLSAIICALRYGIDTVADNFVSQLSTRYNNSADFMGLYGLYNFYIYTMAYIYAPNSKYMMQESGITKDNPAFSMINDSDEEVIYGSEDETRRPLNRARNDDDSD